MSDKNWTSIVLEVNGLEYNVKYNEVTIENVFMPFLERLTSLHSEVDRKLVCYLAAPPCVGKTALSMFLEKLSRERDNVDNIRALSLDGFHFSNSYMDAHFAVRDGSTIPMKMIKGAPETFDLDLLQQKLRMVRQDGTTWPIYDRKIHDVVPNALTVEDDIILLEGNYLLLKNPRWTNIRALADYSVYIKAEPDLLRERLIARKMSGGSSREVAERFYEQSDRVNVDLVINTSGYSDETWQLTADGDYIKLDNDDED